MKPTFKELSPVLLILTLASSCAFQESPSKPEEAPTQPVELIIGDAGSITDIDGNSYPALQIGEQVWMGANMMAVHGPDGEPVDYFCYDDEESNCQIYGRLYTLEAAMHGENEEGSQGICPDGWHIPSMGEWEVLIVSLGGEDTAGRALKEPGDEYWRVASTGGKSKMDILPSGWFDFTLEYRGLGASCFLRSSSSPNPSYASIWILESHSARVERGDLHPDDAIPLRCIKD